MHVQIPSFKNARVLVVGDLMLDRYWHGPTSRISPEAPVPVVHVSEIEERPGGAGNVALNIAVLGAKSTVLGLTGDDDAANALEKNLQASGVNTRFIKLKNNATVTKLRVMSRHQQLIRLDFEDGFVGQDLSAMEAEFIKLLDDHDVVVCSDYGKGCLRNIQTLIALCKKKNIPILIDPKGNDFSKYAGASLITPNLSEFEAVVGHCANDEELVEKAKRLCEQHQLGALLVTRSEHGMSLIESNKTVTHLPTRAREVYDVTGAGDTVISTLAAALAVGQDLPQSTALANFAAGLVVAKSGTASVTVEELQLANREYFVVERGVLDEASLFKAVAACREHGETIVMTNGCFDILHAGHVTYLEQARQLGDRLVVAVNIDETVSRLKGADRPVNKVNYRMRMLSALECVDWVVPFTEDEPTRLICELKPDILVKGGDNDPDKIPGGDCVRAAGGQVKVLSYVDGVSTTEIIGSIRGKGTSI
ncbi:MAG: bifunctional D-glycero-beta-D-manno-heptose-7-phosphate kinase/D-glycero-beta-D-manno-heptose 1-phosphate adenylyltransferase HldE [Gammaproteobacteria bacterium]|nr:bifunctional D-glycero-beta-D-manno-heptose-7-phosphate kinase/D-glycero-beta-D-manno-heptose 1-phosphate adenylyltransferase HldE [Gammaproteobacteria bacterium]